MKPKNVLRVDLRKSDEIYGLIDILKAERSQIDSIDRTPVDFEQVFRKLVSGNGEPLDPGAHGETAERPRERAIEESLDA